MARYHVGVDVGGTNIVAAVVDENGEIITRSKSDTPLESSDALMDEVLATIGRAIDKATVSRKKIDAIGLGVPGVVGENGECIWAPNCPLSGVPVASLVTAEFDRPAVVGNDVNVGTLGELAFGAARGYDSAFGMFVGTGIGGGLVIGGQVITGAHALGAEVGHIIVDFEAARRGDEGGGEFEYYASRTGIERRLRQELAAGRPSLLAERLAESGDDRIRSRLLQDALAAGDELVTEVMGWAADIIGIGTVTVIHICDPEVIVYGGGVIEACGDFMIPRIEESIRKHVAPGNGRPLRIARSELGDDAVLLGAVALAKGVDVSGDRYPLVAAPDFGSVLVDGERLEHDIVIRANGKVVRRRKRLSREVHGTSHEVSLAEIQHVCRGRTERLIVGHGHHGHLTLSRDARAWLEARGISVSLLPTPEAAMAFNNAEGRKALLLHVTC